MERVRSPSKKRPFRFNPKHAAKMARLHRLQRKGLTPPTDKASLRQLADDAVAGNIPHTVKAKSYGVNAGK